MKKIFASVSRLTVAYSKFGIMIFSLSLMNTALKADQGFYYLATNSQFLKLGGVYVQDNQNIRYRKMIDEFIKNKGSI
jgi:hypothetical protein